MEAQQTSLKLRKLTVCNKGFARESGPWVFFPVIVLTGKWLAETGFRAGHVVDITCEDQRLTITLAPEQRFKER